MVLKRAPRNRVDFTPPSSSGKNPFIKKSSEFSLRLYLNVFVSLNSRRSRFTHLITCTANALSLIQLWAFLICLRADKKKRNFLTAKRREDFRSSSCYRDDWGELRCEKSPNSQKQHWKGQEKGERSWKEGKSIFHSHNSSFHRNILFFLAAHAVHASFYMFLFSSSSMWTWRLKSLEGRSLEVLARVLTFISHRHLHYVASLTKQAFKRGRDEPAWRNVNKHHRRIPMGGEAREMILPWKGENEKCK